jgi:hypothetical protein
MDFTLYAESGFRGRKAVWIKNPDQHTDAYYVDFRGAADMIVRRGGSQGPVVGRIEFHRWKRYTEIFFEDNTRVEMAKAGTFSKTQVVNLPAAPQTSPFQWKHTLSHGTKLGGNLKLEDAKGTVLALFARKSSLSSKDGIVTLTVSNISQQLMDQIFVTFMAVEELMRRQRQAAAAAAASG